MAAGSLGGALAELPELRRPLPLPYALGLVVLFGEAGDGRFGRAGARWIARFALERPTVDVRAIHTAVVALQLVQHDAVAARRSLAALCCEHDLRAGATLLLPGDRRRPE